MRRQAGFTFLETLIAVIIISVISALAVKPLRGMVQRIKLQSAANGMKQVVMNARLRAVANPDRQCGVVFRLYGSSTMNDTVFAFLDKNPPNKVYNKGVDSLYLKSFVLKPSNKVVSSIPVGFPSTIVFRGDGSASSSSKVKLTLGNMSVTLDVLASTGRVKVVSQ